MNNEHKSLLRQAIISQTWNQELASEIINAVEEGVNNNTKASGGPSPLQIAIKKEKNKNYKTGPNVSTNNETEE